MSIPPPSHVGSLRQGLRGILNKRKQLPSAFDNAPQLRGIDPVNIRADLRAIFTLASGVSDGEWDKAILVAKAGSNAFINQPNDLIGDPQLRLEAVERDALRDEQDKLSSQRGMAAVIVTVALAAFLQGHVQSSINAASLYAQGLGLKPGDTGLQSRDFQLGTMNASPFLAAALLGAPLSLPTNYYLGRRGALMASAVLIVASSVASAFVKTWIELLGVRIIGGVGMGIKAVTAPILASETAAGFWRGSIMLTWQLWVACGIMVGFVVNLIVAQITGSLGLPLSSDDLAESDQHRQYQTSQWILGAPIVPSVGLFVAVFFCYESPRFYMRQDSPNFRPDQALAILLAIRPTRLQALRDLILIRWSTKEDLEVRHERGLTYVSQLRVVLHLSWQQCRTLFKTPRLRNAISSTCTVALAQQLCGINVFAFYSNTVFINGKHDSGVKLAMAYSFGCGAVNFFFGLGAMRTIDTAGRRAWLLATLPIMSLSLMAAAIAFPSETDMHQARSTVGVVFIFIFVAAYSPGLGPIPFTLASESFPLTHREAGASVAIAINLFFAGILTIVLPAIKTALTTRGTLGFFSGMNVLAFVLVFFLVEETRRLSLEDLDEVYKHSKSKFIKFQLYEWLPYVFKRYALRRKSARNDPGPRYDRYVEEDGGQGDELQHMSE